jgi:hypothetical protein
VNFVQRPISLFAGGAALLLLAACTSNTAPGEGAGPSGGGSGSGSGAGGGGGTVTPSECSADGVPRTALRRLTRFEYANSVRDLLKVDPSPTNDLPADEITNGYDNNAVVLTVSSLHAEGYVLVSEALAKQAVQNLPALTTCDTAALGEDACAAAFAKSFGRRAFRRPTTAADEQMLMAAYTAGRTGGSYAEGIEVMIRAALQSSDFLFRLETTAPADPAQKVVPLSQFELATRLSFLVWGSGPDDALLDAAERGELATKAQVAAKAREMLAQPQARQAVAHFFDQWAGTRRLDITSKSTTQFPEFTTELRDAMARELPAFVEGVVWGGDRTLKSLLTGQTAYVSGPLAELYGVTPPASSGTTPVAVTLPENQGRSGILTQAGFLAVQAHPDQTSPVLRGKFVRAMLLCQPPQPPPPDVDISLPTIDQGATARERFSAHLTAGTTCLGCHSMMDPLGLSFEHFDATGRYRETDNGRPIDVSGEVIRATDEPLNRPFNGVKELGEMLASSPQVMECVATQWFRFAAGRTEEPADTCSLATMSEAFTQSNGDLVELMVATTQTDAFFFRSATE